MSHDSTADCWLTTPSPQAKEGSKPEPPHCNVMYTMPLCAVDCSVTAGYAAKTAVAAVSTAADVTGMAVASYCSVQIL